MTYKFKYSVWLLIFTALAVFSFIKLIQMPDAVAWAGALIAHLVALVSFKLEQTNSIDHDLSGILNVTLGIVVILVSIGQWLIVDITGPLAVGISSSALAFWALRPRQSV